MAISLFSTAPIQALTPLWDCVQAPTVDLAAFQPVVDDLFAQTCEPNAFGMNDDEIAQVQDALQNVSQEASRYVDANGRLSNMSLYPSMASLISAWPARFHPQDDIGREYAVNGLVGGGGLSKVYHGNHVEAGHLVVIKVAEVPEGSQISRRIVEGALRHEYEIMSRLRPGTGPRVYRLGTMNGKAAMAIEHMEGRDLFSVMDELRHGLRTNGDLKRLIGIGRLAVAQIAALHEQGIVHCDIKPENFMYTEHPRTRMPSVRIFDFGLAMREGEHYPFINGTPHYMPPETWREGATADFSRDTFALGVVLYELLTGICPFTGSTPQEIVNQVMTGHIDSPSVVLFRERPDLANVLSHDTLAAYDAVVMQALERNEGLRWQDADDLLRQLDQIPLHTEEKKSSAARAIA